MGYIIYNNELDSTVTTDVTVSSGSIVDDTSESKLLTRALADKYEFTKTGLGSLTITLTLTGTISKNSLSILGLESSGLVLLDITLYNGVSDQGLTTPDPIFKSRYVDGVYVLDEHYIFDNYFTFDKVEIRYADVSGGSGAFQKLYCGTAVEIDFQPIGANYAPSDTSQKDYSNGRQAYVNTGVMYNNLKISAKGLTHSQAWNAGGISINDINLVAGTDQPLILIPNTSENISVYGTQKTLATLTPELKNDGVTEWYWKASLNIEEEL